MLLINRINHWQKIDNSFQHWENPWFIQDWEQHVEDADLDCFSRKKNNLHALGQCAQEFVRKFQHWENPGFIQDWGNCVQGADLACFIAKVIF